MHIRTDLQYNSCHVLSNFLFWPKQPVSEKASGGRAKHTRVTSGYSQGCVGK